MWCMLIVILQLLSLVSATSRAFAPYDNSHQQDQTPQTLQPALDTKQGYKGLEREMVYEEAFKGLSTLGSRPPNCEHRCGGCTPCEAIQVPTTNDRFGVQYANYEPEGWRCKCGVSFFSP
ncbi:hypothetical protein GIB67_005399 [Kingdonia uniflora]|uniref:Epidermal patterning factor-like protein n=1 Tax=Kingdonia uniflora TaxID=39325 RepID=A0A7J7NHA7_9MAGN|nr:hypothetical protein GIB67_005399 [Kingdonia uniflora]